MLNDHDKVLEKFSTIEKIINEIAELPQKVIEFKELATQRQGETEALWTIFENIPQKLYVKDKNSSYVFCNEKYANDLRITPDEIVEKTDYDFFPEDLAAKYASDDRRIIEAGKSEDIEERYIRDGEECWIHTVKTPVLDEHGNIGGILGVFWDITEQKKTEEELARSRARLEEVLSTRSAELQTIHEQLQSEIAGRRKVEGEGQRAEEKNRMILENTGTGVVIFEEEDMAISEANRKFGEICGYSREEVEGKKSLTEFIAQDELEKLKEYFLTRKTRADAVPDNFGCRFLDREGNSKSISVTISGIPGTKKGMASLIDLTNYERITDSLRILEEKYHLLVEGANEAILVIQEGAPRFANSKIQEISGYEKDEVSSILFEKFIHPDDREMVVFRLRRTEELGHSQVFPCKIICKDGQTKWVENRVALIQWEGKAAILNSMVDITERKQAEEELYNSVMHFRKVVNATEKILMNVAKIVILFIGGFLKSILS